MVIDVVFWIRLVQIVSKKSQANADASVMCEKCKIIELDDLAHEIVQQHGVVFEHVAETIERLIGKPRTREIQRSNIVIILQQRD